jgi:hypothetical protein
MSSASAPESTRAAAGVQRSYGRTQGAHRIKTTGKRSATGERKTVRIEPFFITSDNCKEITFNFTDMFKIIIYEATILLLHKSFEVESTLLC